MPLALDPEQLRRSERRWIYPVRLVVIRTYADRDAGTLGEVHYFSEHWFRYPYDGGALVVFEPVIDAISNLSYTMRHVEDFEVIYPRLQLRLRNIPYRLASTVSEVLESDVVEGAEIEVSEVLLDFSEEPRDLEGYSGTEHTRLFRGIVERIGRTDDATLELEAVDITRWWDERTKWFGVREGEEEATNNDLGIDAGIPWPLVFGSPRSWKARVTAHGNYGSLAQSIDAVQTGAVDIEADAQGWSAALNVVVGREEMDISAISDDSMTIAAGGRGVAGIAEPHDSGDPIFEVKLMRLVRSHSAVVQSNANTVARQRDETGRLRKVANVSFNDRNGTLLGEPAAYSQWNQNDFSQLVRGLAGRYDPFAWWCVGRTRSQVLFRGTEAPSASYIAGLAGEIKRAGDVIRYLYEQRITGLAGAVWTPTIPASWNTDADDGFSSVDFDARWLGETVTSIAKRVASYSCANLVIVAGQLYYQRPTITVSPFSAVYPTPIETVDETTAVEPIVGDRREVGELYSRVRVRYAFDPGPKAISSVADPEGYFSTVERTASDPAVGTAESLHDFLLPVTADATHAGVYADWLMQELSSRRWVFDTRVDWIVGYDLIPGDTVTVAPPWLGSSKKCRVLATERSFDDATVRLRLLEVP